MTQNKSSFLIVKLLITYRKKAFFNHRIRENDIFFQTKFLFNLRFYNIKIINRIIHSQRSSDFVTQRNQKTFLNHQIFKSKKSSILTHNSYLLIRNPYICKTKSIKMSKEGNTKEKWLKIQKRISDRFGDGETLDVDAIVYLIGVQELGQGFRKFKKDEKINLMHIAICKLLEPFGYYEFEYFDDDGWPHYKLVEELPALKAGEQTVLLKQAIVDYFNKQQ